MESLRRLPKRRVDSTARDLLFYQVCPKCKCKVSKRVKSAPEDGATERYELGFLIHRDTILALNGPTLGHVYMRE